MLREISSSSLLDYAKCATLSNFVSLEIARLKWQIAL